MKLVVKISVKYSLLQKLYGKKRPQHVAQVSASMTDLCLLLPEKVSLAAKTDSLYLIYWQTKCGPLVKERIAVAIRWTN